MSFIRYTPGVILSIHRHPSVQLVSALLQVVIIPGRCPLPVQYALLMKTYLEFRLVNFCCSKSISLSTMFTLLVWDHFKWIEFENWNTMFQENSNKGNLLLFCVCFKLVANNHYLPKQNLMSTWVTSHLLSIATYTIGTSFWSYCRSLPWKQMRISWIMWTWFLNTWVINNISTLWRHTKTGKDVSWPEGKAWKSE